MVKLLAIAALFAGVQAHISEAKPIEGLTCNYVARDSGKDVRSFTQYPGSYPMGWGFSFAYDGEPGALDTFVNWDDWKADSNCTIKTPTDWDFISRRDYCKKACYLGGFDSEKEKPDLYKWEQTMNNLEMSNDCRTQSCVQQMVDFAKDFIASGGDPANSVIQNGEVHGQIRTVPTLRYNSRRLSELHRRLSESERYSGMMMTWLGRRKNISETGLATRPYVDQDLAAAAADRLKRAQAEDRQMSVSSITNDTNEGSLGTMLRMLKLQDDFLENAGDNKGKVAASGVNSYLVGHLADGTIDGEDAKNICDIFEEEFPTEYETVCENLH